MKKLLGSRIFWGIAVIIGGVMALLDNLNVIDFGEVFWGILAFLGAIFFLSIYLQNRSHWWALVPGISLIGIGLTILVNWLVPEFGEVWGGAILLGGIGLSFFFLYLVDHQNWWAVIPAGIMISIGIAAGIEQTYGDRFGLGIFFLGMGLTFALLPLLERASGVRVLRVSAVVVLIAYAAMLLVPIVWLKVALIAVINVSTAGWFAILRAKCYEALPGQSGVVVGVTSLANLSSLFMPLLIGGVADASSLQVAMWLLAIGPIALIVGVR